MNKPRISVNVQEKILIMQDKYFGIRRTAKVLSIARNTQLPTSKTEKTKFKIDFEKVHMNLNKGISIKVQWQEICFNESMSYTSFYHQYRRQYLKQPEVTMRLVHNASERIFFNKPVELRST